MTWTVEQTRVSELNKSYPNILPEFASPKAHLIQLWNKSLFGKQHQLMRLISANQVFDILLPFTLTSFYFPSLPYFWTTYFLLKDSSSFPNCHNHLLKSAQFLSHTLPVPNPPYGLCWFDQLFSLNLLKSPLFPTFPQKNLIFLQPTQGSGARKGSTLKD